MQENKKVWFTMEKVHTERAHLAFSKGLVDIMDSRNICWLLKWILYFQMRRSNKNFKLWQQTPFTIPSYFSITMADTKYGVSIFQFTMSGNRNEYQFKTLPRQFCRCGRTRHMGRESALKQKFNAILEKSVRWT